MKPRLAWELVILLPQRPLECWVTGRCYHILSFKHTVFARDVGEGPRTDFRHYNVCVCVCVCAHRV
jgi:hypothetical protein